MYKLLIIVMLPLSSFSQKLSFREADSVSYALYLSERWQELTEFGKEAKRSGYNYHFLNLRLGIAHYQLGQFNRSEQYLSRAYKQDEGSDYTAYWLYASCLYTGNTLKAGELYALSGVTEKFGKAVSTIDVEGGSRLSANRIAAGNVNYFSVGMGHVPGKKAILYQSYLYQTQKQNIWGNNQQHQYYLGSSIKLDGYWRFDLAAHLHWYESSIDYRWDTSEVHVTPPTFPGDYRIDSSYRTNFHMLGPYKQRGTLVYLGGTYQRGAYKFSPFVQVNFENIDSGLSEYQWQDTLIEKYKGNMAPLTEVTTSSDTTMNEGDLPQRTRKLIVGASFRYVVPIKRDALTLGFSLYQPIGGGSNNTIFSPNLNYRFPKANLYLSYFYKGFFPLSEEYGSILINTYDIINNRVTLRFDRYLSKLVSIRFTYQYENKLDMLSLLEYKSHLLSAGINFKF